MCVWYLLSAEGSDRTLQRVVGSVRGCRVATPSLWRAAGITLVFSVIDLLYDGSGLMCDGQDGCLARVDAEGSKRLLYRV